MLLKKQKTKILNNFKTIKDVKKVELPKNALEIFKRRYALKDENGNPLETIEQAMYRVGSYVAKAEASPTLKKVYTTLFTNLIKQKRFIPNTPTWTGSDTPLGQLAACFVLPLADDMGKEPDGIFQTLRNAALIQQTGGGVGFSFSKLRPKGSLVNRSKGKASGPVSFLEAFDSAFGKIAQGGTRRGANMGVLRVSHPDIYDFITCKTEEGSVTNFNISVALTDEFMQAVKEDKDFDLVNPHDGKVAKTVKARELFDKIIEQAYKNGEPGALFIDTANKENPVPNQYTLEATNPCGEQWLGPYENCCLGHINIFASVKNGKIDWEHLKESTILATRFLDDVVTQNAYVPAVPQLKEAALKNRRIGLGFLGLADAMYALGVRYGSEESLDFASQITEFIRFYSMKTSIELAKERGPFPGITGSIYDPENLKWSPPTSLVDYKLDLNRPALNWGEIVEGIKEHGIRNSTQMTVAPTGTTSTVFSVEGYGCEPVFALAYNRRVYQSAGQDENLTLTYVSPSFQKALDESSLSTEQKDKIIKEAIEKGTIQHLEDIPQNIKNTFVVSTDITPEEHVMMQAAIQRFVDNSISKTCNFPATATKEDVANVYMKAWELGCKGLTVYVTGSRQETVLETNETAKKKAENQKPEQEQLLEKKIRPAVVYGRTHRIQTPFGKAYVTVNRNGATNTKPFEVFISIGKAGSDISAMAEALGRLISGWLRSSLDPDSSLEEIVDELRGIGGSSSIGFGSSRVSSLPDAVSKVLYKELQLSTKLEEKVRDTDSKALKVISKASEEAEMPSSPTNSTDVSSSSSKVNNTASKPFNNASVCPSCGNMTLILTEGCVKCLGCGYSRC